MSDKPWHDESVLRDMYVERRLSTTEIADELGCDHSTILYWLDKHSIETRSKSDGRKRRALKEPASHQFYDTGSGMTYERWMTKVDGEMKSMLVHRLLAIAEFGTGAVKDKHVHHKNGISWDNRPDNIEVLTQREHNEKHNSAQRMLEARE